MLESVENFTPMNAYFVRVDFDSTKTYTTEGGMTFYHPDNEGDSYQNKPFHGIIDALPATSKLKKGDTVYMNYQCSDTATKFKDTWYYIINDQDIVAKNLDGVHVAYKSVLVEPNKVEKEKIITEYSESLLYDAIIHGKKEDTLHTTSAVVIDCDNEWLELELGFKLNKGDIIEYQKNLDWGYFVNRTEKFYIKWPQYIIRVNGELVNNYIQIEPKEQYIVKNNLSIPNPERFHKCVDGKFAGKMVLVEDKNIQIKSFIKTDFVYGHLE